MRIAIILCQRSLNSDMIIALQTAPGHSFKNPAERVNCILNLGLHGMEVMHKNIYRSPEFTKTYQCNNLLSVRKLLKKDPEKNTHLLKESCEPTMTLMRNIFSRLKLKDDNLELCNANKDDIVSHFFSGVKLDKKLTCI